MVYYFFYVFMIFASICISKINRRSDHINFRTQMMKKNTKSKIDQIQPIDTDTNEKTYRIKIPKLKRYIKHTMMKINS